jgi:hypothetical protein
MRRKNYRHVIVTDEKGKPMAFSENDKQLVYCNYSDWQDEYWPVRFYTIKKAQSLIKKSTQFRQKGNYPPAQYRTMPIDILDALGRIRMGVKYTAEKRSKSKP